MQINFNRLNCCYTEKKIRCLKASDFFIANELIVSDILNIERSFQMWCLRHAANFNMFYGFNELTKIFFGHSANRGAFQKKNVK